MGINSIFLIFLCLNLPSSICSCLSPNWPHPPLLYTFLSPRSPKAPTLSLSSKLPLLISFVLLVAFGAPFITPLNASFLLVPSLLALSSLFPPASSSQPPVLLVSLILRYHPAMNYYLNPFQLLLSLINIYKRHLIQLHYTTHTLFPPLVLSSVFTCYQVSPTCRRSRTPTSC